MTILAYLHGPLNQSNGISLITTVTSSCSGEESDDLFVEMHLFSINEEYMRINKDVPDPQP